MISYTKLHAMILPRQLKRWSLTEMFRNWLSSLFAISSVLMWNLSAWGACAFGFEDSPDDHSSFSGRMVSFHIRHDRGMDDQVDWKSAAASTKASRPNIVFIFSDDHAVQAIGAYGSKINQTPRIDQLAKQGMIFDRSYCCNSICGPSRASVLTGKHSHLNGFLRNGDRFDGTQVTFPKLLQQAGYQTALIGKWHLESEPTGFDHWEILPDQGSYYNPDFIQMDGSRKRFAGHCTDLIGDMSLEWLRGRDTSQPFLLMCQHKAPHRNWSPALRHLGKYPLGTIPEPPTLFDDWSGRSRLLLENEMSIARHFHWGHDMKFHGPNQFPDYFLSGIGNGEYARMSDQQKAEWDRYYAPENEVFSEKLRAGKLSDEEITRWKFQRYMHDYLGSVEGVDENVGRILDFLDEEQLSDDTIVIYASDQGFYLGEHGWFDKRWIFEESLRMPFLIRWPKKIAAGVRSQAMIQNIDYAPTFLEIAGITPPPEMQGRSLLPMLTGRGETPSDWRDCIYYAYYEDPGTHRVAAHDGIRTTDHKLIYFPRSQEWNLFDLVADPNEMISRHDDPAYQSVLKDLQQCYQLNRKQYRVHPAIVPQPRLSESWWADRFRAKVKEAQQVKEVDLVLIGASIIQEWETTGRSVWEQKFPSLKTLNLGFGGDRTEHVLWRLQHDSLPGKPPKAVLLQVGNNNTGHKMQSPEEVADAIREIVETLRRLVPESKIVLLGRFPRGQDSNDACRANNNAINDLIRRLDNGNEVVFLDLGHRFLEPDGTISADIMPDSLHLSETGYQLWAEMLKTEFERWNLLAQ
jgi:N-acetylglucosamine-6-sulfatase